MSKETEQKIIATLSRCFDEMTETQKELLLAYAEGMALVTDKKKGRRNVKNS